MSNAIQPLTEGYLYRRSAIKLHPGSRNSRSLCICVSFRYPSQAGDYISLKPIIPTRRRKISGDLPLRRHKRVVRDAERRAVFLKNWYNNSEKMGEGGLAERPLPAKAVATGASTRLSVPKRCGTPVPPAETKVWASAIDRNAFSLCEKLMRRGDLAVKETELCAVYTFH